MHSEYTAGDVLVLWRHLPTGELYVVELLPEDEGLVFAASEPLSPDDPGTDIDLYERFSDLGDWVNEQPAGDFAPVIREKK